MFLLLPYRRKNTTVPSLHFFLVYPNWQATLSLKINNNPTTMWVLVTATETSATCSYNCQCIWLWLHQLLCYTIQQANPSELVQCRRGKDGLAGRISKNKHIKQFVLTNCSKERPGSIVTETVKAGIFIIIATSKE